MMENIAKQFPKMQTGYEKVPRQLMGFVRNGANKGFDETKYPFALDVDIHFPDGEVYQDTIKGMNLRHALERAKENWPAANYIMPTNPELAKKAYLGSIAGAGALGAASFVSPERANAEALQEPLFDPTILLSGPARLGGGMMNMGIDALMRYFTK